jgi:hypothetical protein
MRENKVPVIFLLQIKNTCYTVAYIFSYHSSWLCKFTFSSFFFLDSQSVNNLVCIYYYYSLSNDDRFLLYRILSTCSLQLKSIVVGRNCFLIESSKIGKLASLTISGFYYSHTVTFLIIYIGWKIRGICIYLLRVYVQQYLYVLLSLVNLYYLTWL